MIKSFYNRFRLPIILTMVVILVIVVGLISTNALSSENNSTATLNNYQTSQVVLNRDFTFPINDQNNREIAKITYTLDKAELTREIIVQGEKATAAPGRAFLIINLKVKNDFNQPIEVNTRDYIRLTIKDNPDLLAPDIHNDPVAVQAISTKYTRIGFPVDENQKSFQLHVGQIRGEKTIVDMEFK